MKKSTLDWSRFLDVPLRRLLCNALPQPHFYYSCTAWYPNSSKKLKDKLHVTQNNCIRFCLKLYSREQYQMKISTKWTGYPECMLFTGQSKSCQHTWRCQNLSIFCHWGMIEIGLLNYYFWNQIGIYRKCYQNPFGLKEDNLSQRNSQNQLSHPGLRITQLILAVSLWEVIFF